MSPRAHRARERGETGHAPVSAESGDACPAFVDKRAGGRSPSAQHIDDAQHSMPPPSSSSCPAATSRSQYQRHASLRVLDHELVQVRDAIFMNGKFHARADPQSMATLASIVQPHKQHGSRWHTGTLSNCKRRSLVEACVSAATTQMGTSHCSPPTRCPPIFGADNRTLFVQSGLSLQQSWQPGTRPISSIRLLQDKDFDRLLCKRCKKTVRVRDALVFGARYNCPTLYGGSFWEWLNEVFMPGYHMHHYSWKRWMPERSAPMVLFEQKGMRRCPRSTEHGRLASGWTFETWGGTGLRMLPRKSGTCVRVNNAIVGISRAADLTIKRDAAGAALLAAEAHALQTQLANETRAHWSGSSVWAQAARRAPSKPHTLLWLKRSRRRAFANDTAVVAAAHAVGLDVVRPKSGLLGERLALLKQTDIVFLPHGADGGNLLLMQPCTLVVQLCPCGYRDSDGCGQHYFGNLVSHLGGWYIGAHLQQDDDPASQRGCVEARKKWNNATMFASSPFLVSLFARARREYQHRIANCSRDHELR